MAESDLFQYSTSLVLSCLPFDTMVSRAGMIGGSKLYVYEWVDEKLVGRSFYDAHFYISTIKTLKFYIIFGDQRHSVHLRKLSATHQNDFCLPHSDHRRHSVRLCKLSAILSRPSGSTDAGFRPVFWISIGDQIICNDNMPPDSD